MNASVKALHVEMEYVKVCRVGVKKDIQSLHMYWMRILNLS